MKQVYILVAHALQEVGEMLAMSVRKIIPKREFTCICHVGTDSYTFSERRMA